MVVVVVAAVWLGVIRTICMRARTAQVRQNASVLNAAVTALLRNGRKKEAIGLYGRISSAEIKAIVIGCICVVS